MKKSVILCLWFVIVATIGKTLATTAPSLTPQKGESFTVFPLVVVCPDFGADIRYTVNGSEPTLDDPKVESGERIIVNRNWTIKAKAWVSGVQSTTTTGDFTLTGDLAAGGSHSLSLSAIGSASAWGQHKSGQLAIGQIAVTFSTVVNVTSPSRTRYWNGEITDGTMLAAGMSHSLFLKSGGTVWASGLNTSGQLGDNSLNLRVAGVQVKKSIGASDFLTGCTGIAAGDSFSLALASNGEVWAWGNKASGSLGDGTTSGTRLFAGKVYSGTTGTVPLAGIGRIAARGSSGLALEPATGNVWAWGNNASGQLGQGNSTSLARALKVRLNSTTFLTDALDISNGQDHSVILRWKAGDPALQGRVFCFGQQQYGRLGNNSVAAGAITYPVQVVKSGGIPLDRIVSVAGGTAHTLALDLNGNVWAWGYNQYGALGDGTVVSSGIAVKVKNPSGTGDLANIVRIAAGGTGLLGHSLAVASDGTVYAWGNNVNGQLGNGVASATIIKLPVAVGGNLDLLLQAPSVTVSGLLVHTMGTILLTASPTDADNNIHKVEFYCNGRLIGTDNSSPYQSPIPNLASGPNQAYAKVIDSTGLYGTSLPLSIPLNANPSSVDQDRDGLPSTWESQNGLDSMSAYGNAGAEGDLDGDGFSNVWEYLQGSAPNAANSLPKGMISAGDDHTVAVASDGRVWGWGGNSGGELGDGTTISRNSPVLVPRVQGMKRIVKVGTGQTFTLALDEAGCLWGWGANSYNVLSPSSTYRFTIPVKLDFKTPISDFSCGNGHVIATDRWGKIWTWGYNGYGQLGLGHTNAVASPTELSRPPGMGEIVSTAASNYSTYGIDSAGKVWSWGYNYNGVLGDGTVTNRSVPVAVSLSSGLPAIRSIGSKDGHVIAIGTNGTVWTWGYNGYGQLGTGNSNYSYTPVSISSGFALGTQVAAGTYHSMVISQTGAVWTWGYNGDGQLGSGSTTNSYSPINTSASASWNSLIGVSAGANHSLALKSDGSLWSWGGNFSGQLGHGDTSSQTVPTRLLNLKLSQDDSDSDGISDSWEKFYFGNLGQGSGGIYTVGGVTNSVAYARGLDPLKADFDKDGIPDLTELAAGLDPIDWTDATGDLDGDRVPNLWEYAMGTSMLNQGSRPAPNVIVTGGQSIQTAINSLPGNYTNPPWVIVQVEAGVYLDRVTLPSNLRVLLVSGTTGIPEIRGPSGNESINASGECMIDGFRITHGKGSTGGGVEFFVSGDRFPARISNCLIHNNSGVYQGGGIEIQSGRVVVSHCSIFRNSATNEGNAIWVSSSANARLTNSILWNPTGAAPGETRSYGYIDSDSALVRDGSVPGSILGNPLMNPQGFLTKASPMRYSGSRRSGTSLDIQKESRGNLPDIGADQFMDLDNDGLPDYLEAPGGTSAADDNDSDGLTNLQEYEITGSSLGYEDTDGDGLNDAGEFSAGTDVFDPDSDSDGMPDGDEVLYGLSPLKESDALEDLDRDRIPNVYEIANGTLPNNASSVPPPFITVDRLIATETALVKKTIQAAISSTILPTSGYMIVRVKAGTYAENISIDQRKILLLGDLGASVPVLSPTSGDALQIYENSAVIDGFWIKPNITNTFGRATYIAMDAASDQFRIVNCMITGFTASSASAMTVSTGRVTVAHCTVMDNSGAYPSRAVSVYGGKLAIQNSILWNIDKGAANEIYESTAGSTTVTSSIIKGGAFGAIASDPKTDRYYCLMSGSPAMRAGTQLLVSSVDIQGESRSTSPDIGADQRVDSDSDELPDWWENFYFGNLSKTWSGDNDSPTPDRLLNGYEYLLGLNPFLASSPGSVVNDLYHAVFVMQPDPFYPKVWWLDPDADGLTDNYEFYYQSDPMISDTNGDGIWDLLAIQSGISPASSDTDSDGISNSAEIQNGTNPLLADTDGDGVNDNLDPLPLDPTVTSLPTPSPIDVTPPTISLQKPAGAILQP